MESLYLFSLPKFIHILKNERNQCDSPPRGRTLNLSHRKKKKKTRSVNGVIHSLELSSMRDLGIVEWTEMDD